MQGIEVCMAEMRMDVEDRIKEPAVRGQMAEIEYSGGSRDKM